MRRFARFGTICTIKKPAKGCNFTKSNTPSWVIFMFFKLYKWYQIAQGITYKNIAQNWQDIITKSDSKGLLKMLQKFIMNCASYCKMWEKFIIKYDMQKQPSRGILRKKYSENMQQIYRRTPMPKWDFIKVQFSLIEITLWYECSPVNLLHIYRITFSKNTSGWIR